MFFSTFLPLLESPTSAFGYYLNTSNQRLGSVFDDLDPRLSLLYQVGDDVSAPAKSARDARYAPQDPFIHLLINCPIQS